VLDADHSQMAVMLDKLGTLVDPERTLSERPLRALAREVHAYFSVQAKRHHADEEAHIFPGLLDSADPALRTQVARLRQDHGWLEQDWRELAPAIDSIAEGIGGVDGDMLRESVDVYTALYQEHIVLEETIAYPEARRLAAAEAAGCALRRASALENGD
jgi:hemerythrin-like domain-containing protein